MNSEEGRVAASPDRVHTYNVKQFAVRTWPSGALEEATVTSCSFHGFQNDHTAWRPLVERLDEDRYRFTSFDLLGCGANGGADTWERCTIEECGADLTALCDVLDLIDRSCSVTVSAARLS